MHRWVMNTLSLVPGIERNLKTSLAILYRATSCGRAHWAGGGLFAYRLDHLLRGALDQVQRRQLPDTKGERLAIELLIIIF